jgi:hypothetical protein
MKKVLGLALVIFALSFYYASAADDVQSIITKAKKALTTKNTLMDNSYAQGYNIEMDYGIFEGASKMSEPLIKSKLPDESAKIIIPLRIYHRLYNQIRVEFNVMGQRMIYIQNADKNWVSSDSKGERFKEADSNSRSDNAEFQKLFEVFSTRIMMEKLDDKNAKITSSGKSKIDGKELVTITYVKDADSINYWFDAKSYVLGIIQKSISISGTGVEIVSNYDEMLADKKYFAVRDMNIKVFEKQRSSNDIEFINITIGDPQIDFDVELLEEHFLPPANSIQNNNDEDVDPDDYEGE